MVSLARKRGHGEGTARFNTERGYWEARFSYNDPATGTVKRKKFTGAKQGEALSKGRAWIVELQDGLLPDAGKITLWEWLDRWLTDYVKRKVRIKSFDKYEGCLRCYVKPALGNVPLLKVKSPDVQRLFNNLLENGGRERKIKLPDGTEVTEKRGISSSTVKATRRYLSMAIDQAVKVGLLTKNVVKDTQPPKLVKKEIRPLNKQQAGALTAMAKEDAAKAVEDKVIKESVYMAMLLALATGARLGEIFGLKWDCVDITKGVIHIKRALVTGKSGRMFEEPKTAKSRRQIPVPNDVVDELRRYKKWQDWQRHLLGNKWQENDLVITNQIGNVMNTSNFTTRYFKKLLERSGIDRSIKFHDLRHTHATLLLLQGINPKIVQERLGHSTVTMTLDTYSHLLPDMQDAAVKALEGMFLSGG